MHNTYSFSPFKPTFLLRHALIQTVLASSKIRILGANPMLQAAAERIIELKDGTRLLGYMSRTQNNSSKGLVVLIHGWEGGANSTYILSTGKRLFNDGYDVFRINLRDHGETHHLNKGFFWASMDEEVFEAFRIIAEENSSQPLFLVGFSLGGSFAMRLSLKCRERNVENLRHVVGISPLLDPAKATAVIDASPPIKSYFLKKWKKSLIAKQSLFPEEYRHDDIINMDNILVMTKALVDRYSHYESVDDYFRKYTLVGDALKENTIPMTLVTAKDDPVIPVDDFYKLELNDSTRLVIHDHGGHSGFVKGFSMRSWYEGELSNLFDSIVL